MGADDEVILCDPVYFGGTVDRSQGSQRIIDMIEAAGGKARYIPARDDVATYLLQEARSGDRIVVMGARDDTLTLFAKNLLAQVQ